MRDKIVYSEIVREPQFHLDSDLYYPEATAFVITGKRLEYLVGLLNSKFVSFIFKRFYAGGGLGKEGYRYKKAFVKEIPIPRFIEKNKSQADNITNLVENILSVKTTNLATDTREQEAEIDRLIYSLYDLTPKEISLVAKN